MTMFFSNDYAPEILNRARGVLVGQAVGDALGVPYEFATKIPVGTARMIGGGLGPYAPGEFSDDTQMAMAVADALNGQNYADDVLESAADNFLYWYSYDKSDIGAQTALVLSTATKRAGRRGGKVAPIMRSIAAGMPERAGNGSLMRTAVVALFNLHGRNHVAHLAADISGLTHSNNLAQEACVLWTEAVRVAVLTGTLDIRAGLDLLGTQNQATWNRLINEAEEMAPEEFAPNGYVVTAFQAAWSAIRWTHNTEADVHFSNALHRAVAIGDDTDTVAAIAGSLLGACYGLHTIPQDWRDSVHGVFRSQSVDADDMVSLTDQILRVEWK